MLREFKKLRGLDLRSSDILRDPASATDCSNVELDAARRIRTRFGYEITADLPEGTLDAVEYTQSKELIVFTTTGLFRLRDGEFHRVTYSGFAERPTWTVAPSTAEWRGVLYFSDPDLNVPLFKYDGNTYYRAGVPKAEVVVTEGADISAITTLEAGVARLKASEVTARGSLADAIRMGDPGQVAAARANLDEAQKSLEEGQKQLSSAIDNAYLPYWSVILRHTDFQGNVTYGEDNRIDISAENEEKMKTANVARPGGLFDKSILFETLGFVPSISDYSSESVIFKYPPTSRFPVPQTGESLRFRGGRWRKRVHIPPEAFPATVSITSPLTAVTAADLAKMDITYDDDGNIIAIAPPVKRNTEGDLEFLTRVREVTLGLIETINNNATVIREQKLKAGEIEEAGDIISFDSESTSVWVESMGSRVLGDGSRFVSFKSPDETDFYFVPFQIRDSWEVVFAAARDNPQTATRSIADALLWKIIDTRSISSNTRLSFTDSSRLTRYDLPETPPLANSYDNETSSKLLPPPARYLGLHGNILVMGNAANAADRTGRDTLSDAGSDQTVYSSNLYRGSTAESFGAFDYRTIGESIEGPVRGMFSERQQLVIFKERQIYGMAGSFTTGQLRIDKLMTNEIGCIAPRSIREIANGCFFISERGAYVLSIGGALSELSNNIEPLFTENLDNLDWENAKTVHLVRDEKFYISVSDRVYLFDYYHKEWFVYHGLPIDTGIATQNKQLLYLGNGKLNTRNRSDRDAGKRIPSFYTTGWYDGGLPSLIVHVEALIILRHKRNSDYMIERFDDYNTDQGVQAEYIIQDKSSPTVKCPSPPDRSPYAAKFKISSKTGMVINGLGVVFEQDQVDPSIISGALAAAAIGAASGGTNAN